ncbi:MAG: ABC transporter ATP-binding protein [Phycisphaerales bacterium]|nr:ABC transporter ATP-binding protein [Phycisphaerales bacterium]
MPILEMRRITLSFGGLCAIRDFDLVLDGQNNRVHGIIGPNGAGKTTLFNIITGVYQPDEGKIYLGESLLTGLPTHKIAQAGIARTFQNIRLFGDLSVLDNVRIGGHVRRQHQLWQTILGTRGHRQGERVMTEMAHALLKSFGLAERWNQDARHLSYGDQRRLEIARALATQPRVLLLDEPAAGMNSSEKNELAQLLLRVQEQYQLTMLLIEHDIDMVRRLAQEITVLDHGQIIARGKPDAVCCDDKVIEAYLGKAQTKGQAHG